MGMYDDFAPTCGPRRKKGPATKKKRSKLRRRTNEVRGNPISDEVREIIKQGNKFEKRMAVGRLPRRRWLD